MSRCPDCDQETFSTVSRRQFVQTIGTAAAVAAVTPRVIVAANSDQPKSETLVKKLYDSLTPQQKEEVCFDWDHVDDRGLLRMHVSNNWQITGLKVASGDVIFIRTGRWMRRAEKGPWDHEKDGSAGLYATCAKWLKTRDVALLGSDAASDVLPSGVDGVTHPIHLLTLYAMGVAIFGNCDLEEVSKACAARNRWEFLLTASPLPVPGGTGSPLNPIATF